MHGSTQIVLISLFAILLRWCVAYHSYSGQGKPPMFGDYEAQRHWQEITFNIPIEKWYRNTTDNDLQYWGLDYPPLTAYHSFALGYIANKLNSSYVKLHESRGISTEDHKYFMRLSVLCIDVLLYIPSIVYFILNNNVIDNGDRDEWNILGLKRKHINLSIMLIYPGLILIDHGHFQYNCFSLGLFITAVTALLKNSSIIGSILFVAALNYKQMELYHSLPIFFYILGKYSPTKKHLWTFNILMLLCVSITVILAFIVIWLPFLKNFETFGNVVFRLFPVARGVFEDKVANIWCTVNVAYKLRNTLTNAALAKVCLALTTIALLPSCINLYLNPHKEKFITSLINCSLAFFLFSFQVHEKSILLVAIPVLLHFQDEPFACFWFLVISHFSMLPLFIKDNLYTAYCSTLTFYFFFVWWVRPDIFNKNESLNNIELQKAVNITSSEKQYKKKLKLDKNRSPVIKSKQAELHFYKNNFHLSNCNLSSWIMIVFYCSILGVVILSLISGVLTPPNKYPDLFALLVSIYSCGHFIAFFVYFNYKQFLYKII